jgi:hypothetical protein
MPCVLACPRCGERLDVDLSARELIEEPYSRSRERYELESDGEAPVVTFRLPTGADQEAVAPVALDDPETAAALVLGRCVDAGGGLHASMESFADELSSLMRHLDPQAEIRLDMSCPACTERFGVVFDIADYLFRELAARAADLEREVHELALHYHWSEADILRLTHRKRRRYLELVAESVGGGRA